LTLAFTTPLHSTAQQNAVVLKYVLKHADVVAMPQRSGVFLVSLTYLRDLENVVLIKRCLSAMNNNYSDCHD